MSYYRQGKLKALIYSLIDFVSFNNQTRDLVDILNRKVEQHEDTTPDLLSHPGGFSRAFHKRRMRIAEAYIRIARDLRGKDARIRLHALKTLIKLSLHAKTVSMPLNTARVQTKIMKEVIKNLDNKRKQMEMIADFTLVSYGQEAVIRRFLKNLKLLEVPEKGMPLKELDLGWDDHLHDYFSEGRKNPSQLILDAFIKGISRLTIAYYDIPDQDAIFESMEAGRILGIEISIGIEFSVGPKYGRRHFMFTPPICVQDDIINFCINHNTQTSATMQAFRKGLEGNRIKRRQTVTTVLENFNQTYLVRLNEGFADTDVFAVPPFKFQDLEELAPFDQLSRNHLKKLLFTVLAHKFRNRVLGLKVQVEIFKQLLSLGKMSNWELERVREQYRSTRERYTHLSPDELSSEYLSGKKVVDYDSAFALEKDILPALKSIGGKITFHLPLEQNFEVFVTTVINNYQYIDMVELFNGRDTANTNPSEIIRLCSFVDFLNNRSLDEFKAFLTEWGIKTLQPETIAKAVEHFRANPLIPTIGSASTGWQPKIPGMGFIRDSSIAAKSHKNFVETHYRLPAPVSKLIVNQGRVPDRDDSTATEHIYSLGKSSRFKPNLVGDEEHYEHIGLKRLWVYLNPALKNTLRVMVGLIPALYWVGPFYTMIWFGITFFRNVFVDLISSAGFKFTNWSYKDINFDNATQSLFWTGFSVPILGSAKLGFDLLWPWEMETSFFVWSKFLTICLANGIYISSHNIFRNFDKHVIRANFFRSILAFPIASIFAPLGNLIMVPSIVQAKFWSDMVAAMIEGLGKFRQRIVLRRRDLLGILPLLESKNMNIRLTAMLDILFIWTKRQRGRTCLTSILKGRQGGLISFPNIFRKKEQKQELPCSLEHLHQLFNPLKAQFQLTCFVLEKFTDHEVVVLTELIQDSLTPFYEWLKKLKEDS